MHAAPLPHQASDFLWPHTMLSGATCVVAAAAAAVYAAEPGTGFPGAAWLHPRVHFTASVVSTGGGWHDVAGALTNKGVHHIFQVGSCS